MTCSRIFALILALVFCVCLSQKGQGQTTLRVALLHAGERQDIPLEIKTHFKRHFESPNTPIRMLDAELAFAASRGVGYAGSINLTLAEARDIGASIGCDFFFLIRNETLRRSSSAMPVYYEAATVVMLVSTRTGKLVLWDYVAAESETAMEAERLMLAKFQQAVERYRVALLRQAEDESVARRAFVAQSPATPSALPIVIDEDYVSPDAKDANGTAHREGATKSRVRPPQPYRRPRPAYTESARRAAVEATIDVEVEVLPDGNVGQIEVMRWGGFGLDDAVTEAVRQTHFRPAMRDGAAVLSRVLLRYNFRRPT